MSQDTTIKPAVFSVVGGKSEKPLQVDFNPSSLKYTIKNTLKEKGRGSKRKQHVTQSTAQLSMELIFDTTLTGEDVRLKTLTIANYMEPEKKVPPIVLFEWGAFKFQGMVESYQETLDFFAPNGIPLRSSVNVTMSRQDKVFEDNGSQAKFDTKGNDRLNVVVPTGGNQNATPDPLANNQSQQQSSPAGVAKQAGDPRAASAIAAANGQNSLRFSAGDSLVVGQVSQLGSPTAFATADASLTFDAGSDASPGASFRANSSASAGVSATAGAFSSLRTPQTKALSASFDAGSLISADIGANLATDSSASFGLGGTAKAQAGASLSADVGADASLKGMLKFD